jgi:hypothetical protein
VPNAMRWIVGPGLVATLLAPAALPAQKVSLKDAQKAIRERILTEAGTDSLIYSRVDFNDCAVTIQTRTPRRADGAETRATYTFHATSLDPHVPEPGADGTVRLKTLQARPSLRAMVQRVDSGKVREAVSSDSAISFHFAQEETARTVARAFRRLVAMCGDADRFRKGGR